MITHVGTTNAASGVLNTATPPLSPGWQAGDLFWLEGRAGSGDSPTGPADYTLLPCYAGTEQLKVWYKIATSSESAPVVTGTIGNTRAMLSVFRGVRQTNPHVASDDQANPSGTATTAPSITVAEDGSLLIHGAATTGTTPSHTPPAGFTEPTNGDMGALYVSYKLNQPAGATGTQSGTLSSAVTNLAVLAAFAPAPSIELTGSIAGGSTARATGLSLQRPLAASIAGGSAVSGWLRTTLWDDFERPNTAGGTLGTAPTGQTWALSGNGFLTAHIEDGRYVSGTPATGQNVYAYVTLPGKAIELRGWGSWLAGTPQSFGVVVTQWPDAGAFIGNLIHGTLTPTYFDIELWENGAKTIDLERWPLALPQDGSVHTVRYTVSGETITVWLPGETTPRTVSHPKVAQVHGRTVWFQIFDVVGVTSGPARFEQAAAQSGPVVHPLTATVAGSSSTRATGLRLAHSLTGSLTGASAVTAAIRLAHPLGAAVAGASAATATRLVMDHPLGGALAGSSSAAVAVLAVGHPLIAAMAGGSTARATRLTMAQPLSGAMVGASAISSVFAPPPKVIFPAPSRSPYVATGARQRTFIAGRSVGDYAGG